MFVISHLPTTVLFSCIIKKKKKSKPPQQKQTKKNNHICTIKSKSAPSENIKSAEIIVLKHKENSQVWPNYWLSFFYSQL